ncbi:MAG TPA: chitobiase/beta-hexosaminidase C-terminal domain-containing protein [Arenibacter sp.]|nr:chitobiase/beta-hexosaminidase C-terminal domain-containing protein [Arenibacter sp.]
MIAHLINIGRLHPLLVHLPIGILILTFLLEIYGRRKNEGTENHIVRFALGITVISTLLSLGTGWMLGEDGGYDETLLFRHRWMAVALGIGTLTLYLIKSRPARWNRHIYMPLFIIVLLLLGITGHLGGSMTHGEDYLFKAPENNRIIITDVDKALVYNDIIQPILDQKCVSCHNPGKTKGGLLLTGKEQILAGGDSGSLLAAGDGEVPRLVHHIKLPLDHKEHMPPKGKNPLTDQEIDLLEWWVENANCFDCTTGALDKTEHINKVLLALEEDTSPRALIAKQVGPVSKSWLNAINKNGYIASRIAMENPLLIINLSGIKNLGKPHFKALKMQADNIVELNLGNSNFNDTLARYLSGYRNITKLQLQNTSITDKTLNNLHELKYLESLNLYGTQITQDGLQKLKELPGLKMLYLWNTGVSRAEMDAFGSDNPDITLVHVDKDIFAPSSLNPPTMTAATDFFKDSLEVALDDVFKDTDIYYTLDGSAPDSTSHKYTEPIILTRSTELRAVTHKKGWKLSEEKTGNYKKTTIDFTTIILDRPPHEKYPGMGEKTLLDKKRGSLNILDGNWLGYEADNLTAIIALSKETVVSTISVGAYSSPEKWIFYPKGFKVWVSNDGKAFQLVHNMESTSQQSNSDTKLKFFDFDIPPTKTNYIKVEVQNQHKNPTWHPEPGGNSWLFVDEIVLN